MSISKLLTLPFLTLQFLQAVGFGFSLQDVAVLIILVSQPISKGFNHLELKIIILSLY